MVSSPYLKQATFTLYHPIHLYVYRRERFVASRYMFGVNLHEIFAIEIRHWRCRTASHLFSLFSEQEYLCILRDSKAFRLFTHRFYQHPCDRDSHSRSTLVIVKRTEIVVAGVQQLG